MIPRLPHGFSHPVRAGSGAFASVYRVQQAALDRRVALKFVYEKNRGKRHELLKEAQTQARLRAECVPQIFDAFEWHGSVCMVMEWVRGVSLAHLLEASLSTEDRLSLADSFIRALAEIHRLGYVHRDIKPENILLSPENGMFLVDFGFSKNIAEAAMSSVTEAKGTPAYMAPELWSSGSGKVDLMRIDVFAAGKVLLQVLDGTASYGFASSSVSVNPLQRPSSGMELLEVWEKEPVRPVKRSWKKLAGEFTADQLSVLLFTAAKELLFAHRNDEAYWLLVESLEENSANHEAVELLTRFQEHTGKNKNITMYSVFSVVLVAGIVLAFMAGLHSRPAPATGGMSAERGSTHKLPASNPYRYGALPGKATLRHDSLKTDKLCGTLLVRNLPNGGSVVIDEVPVNSDTAVSKGVFIGSGSHDVVIRDSFGIVIKRETIGILPFQIKAVDAKMYLLSTRGLR